MTEQNGKMLSIQSEELVVLFRRASRLMARASHRRDHSHHAQEHVLSIIRQYGSINQSDLLEILDVRSSSLSEVLGKLERNGLIARERNEQDKRSFVISAIDHEASRETGPHSSSEENVDFLFACLGDEEREQLTGILNKIILSMTRRLKISISKNWGISSRISRRA